jgi:glycosyltransferase involved in cell wall biosynthesis
MEKPAISVVICTHNPRADYFGCTLAALRAQTLPAERWELIVIDNRSVDPLQLRADLSWHPFARVVREETLGLTPARLRGIREAAGELLVFVDDDNVLDADFLEVALCIADEKPFLGSWSGQCRPGLEEPPAEWSRRYFGNLVLREFDEDRWSNLPRLAETMPCGAGLCVRRSVAQEYLRLHEMGARDFQLDRIGDSLLSGGDNDLAACACDIGLGMGIIAGLKLTHLIPPERLTLAYLSRLAEGIYFSTIVLAYLRESSAEIASYRIRWHEPLRAFLKLGPHRAIQFAALRGRRKGLMFVKSLDRTHS